MHKQKAEKQKISLHSKWQATTRALAGWELVFRLPMTAAD
jgi:hypothetical protein